MSQLLQYFLWIPLAGLVLSVLIPAGRERAVSFNSIATAALHVLGISSFIVYWITDGKQVLDAKHMVLFTSGNVEIFIAFYFDSITAVFCAAGSILFLVVSIFSRYYLHRDAGFKRFFVCILLFFFGYNVVIFSGNFETLFFGWEILGICSFLLIGFYRDRFLPVKNSLKVISVYRVADVCLILAMWMSHHYWHENVTFLKLSDPVIVAEQFLQSGGLAIFISLMIVFAAVIKSAQFPFSSWLPRAMEGPTTSSAIFYGSLSVHLGIFVLLRTYPLWQDVTAIRIVIIVIGALSAITAASIAQTQSTVKTQVAYASIAQIGIMFIEVAVGLHWLALIHFAGNALLRTYQLLVSPSVLSYLTHHQFYHFDPSKQSATAPAFKKLQYSLYILCTKEWNLDSFQYQYLWKPFKWIGLRFGFLNAAPVVLVLLLLVPAGLYMYFDTNRPLGEYGSHVFALIALILILKSFAERAGAQRAWVTIFASHVFIAIAIGLNRVFDATEILLYLSGPLIAVVVGYVCLEKVRAIDSDIEMNRFHGYAYERPHLSVIFLLACLACVTFPITPAFIGFDLLLTHIEKDQYGLILLMGLCFLFMELSALRIYARIFLGQHKKTDHAIAYRSS